MDSMSTEPATTPAETPRAPEGAEWFVSVDFHYRPSSGPIIFRSTEDGRRLTNYEEAVTYGQTLLEGENYTAARSRVAVGWQLPLRHPDGQF